jgi:hypothetical protein
VHPGVDLRGRRVGGNCSNRASFRLNSVAVQRADLVDCSVPVRRTPPEARGMREDDGNLFTIAPMEDHVQLRDRADVVGFRRDAGTQEEIAHLQREAVRAVERNRRDNKTYSPPCWSAKDLQHGGACDAVPVEEAVM